MAKNSATNTGDDLEILSGLKLSQTNRQANSLADNPGAEQSDVLIYNVSLNLIEEDPEQPRDESNFNEEEIKNLAADIKKNGLQSAISIRKHPNEPGKYIINYGARRYRAHKELGKKSIEAKIENGFSEEQQVSENLHRENLSNRSIMRVMAKFAAKGMKSKDIALALNKSPSWVTQHMTILETDNAAVREAFESGKVESFTGAYELIKLAKKNGEANEAIRQLLADTDEITKADITRVKNRLKNEVDPEPAPPAGGEVAALEGQNTHEPSFPPADADNSGKPEEPITMTGMEGEGGSHEEGKPAPRPPKPITFVLYKDEEAILVNKAASKKSKVIIKTPGGNEIEVSVKNITGIVRNWPE